MLMTRVLTWAALSIATAALGQRLPPSPCPSMFQYQPDGPQWTGLIRVNSPSLVSNLRLNIKMSIGARLPSRYVGRLELLGEQAEIIQQVLSGGVLRYRVHFPLISPLPRLTAIFLNGDLLCQGPPERGGYVTTINLDHALSTGTQIASLNRPTGGFTRPGDFAFGQDGVFNQQGGVYNQGGLFDQQGGVYGQDGDIIIEQLYPVTQPSQARPPVTENSKPKNPYQDNNPIVFDVNAGVGTYNNETVELRPIGNGQYMVVYNSRPNPDSFARPIIVDTKEDNKVDEKPVTPGPDANRPCGVSKQKAVPLIVGGESTSRGEWPWLAAIFVKKVSSLDYVCGGSIVSSKHIITAAHCVHSKGNRVVKVTEILVKVGAFNLQDWTDEYARTVAVSDVVLYPDFVATQILNTDISILVLAKTLTFSDYVIPVCLWDEDVDLARVVGQKATVVGWGRDENGLRATPEPRRAAITIVSTETCRLSRQDFQYLTNEKTLCAGDRDGSGPCNGDSGGGLFLYRGGRWMLRGVVSNSLPDPNSTNTCNLHEYVIFTDTAKYLAWIHKVMAE